MKSSLVMDENEQEKCHFYLDFLQIMRKASGRKEHPHIPCTYAGNSECHCLLSPRQSRNDCECSTKTLNKYIHLRGRPLFFENFCGILWEMYTKRSEVTRELAKSPYATSEH